MPKKLSEIFQDEPTQWGLRGDPFLWKEMKNMLEDYDFPNTEEQFTALIKQSYEKLTGTPLTTRNNVFVERFNQGGMSSGYVSAQFWIEKAIPMLHKRYLEFQTKADEDSKDENSDEIVFNSDDCMIFYVDDPQLRVDALKNSVFPKLNLILNNTISVIRAIYDVEVLDDSTVSLGPTLKTKRTTEIEFAEFAYAALSGKRTPDKWLGMKKKSGKTPQIAPFRYSFCLSEYGLNLKLDNYWLKDYSKETYQRIFHFIKENESMIHFLSYYSEFEPVFHTNRDSGPIASLQEYIQYFLESGEYTFDHITGSTPYPINLDTIYNMCMNFVILYPLYDSYIQIASGKTERFKELVYKLNNHLKGISFSDRFQLKSGLVRAYDEQLS